MIVPGTACAELQIIAKDARGLSVADRAIICEAAEQYRDVCRELVAVQRGFEESLAKRRTLEERVYQLRKELAEIRRAWCVPSWARFY